MAPAASIVIPTRARPDYLQVALASIAPQAATAGAEVLVVEDGAVNAETRALAERFGAAYVPHARPLGLNAARNTGVERSSAELVVFVDDDIRAGEGWLAALLDAARRHSGADVFAGPINPVLEGHSPPGCGRAHPPITSLQLGPEDRETPFAWGANMAIRRSALQRTGPFDVALAQGGDEQEWQERHLRAGGSPAHYVAAAGVEHRRAGVDARLRSLSRGAWQRGRGARRFDAFRAQAPPLRQELLTLARCAGHVILRRCPAGIVQAAHSAGRVRESLREAVGTLAATARGAGARAHREPNADGVRAAAAQPGSDDFLSGQSGTVAGANALVRRAQDAVQDGLEVASGRRRRLTRAARSAPSRRRVLVLSVVRASNRRLARRALRELSRSRHELEVHSCEPGDRGKFENINGLLAAHPAQGHDWLLVIDDDVELPRGFLDRLLFVCERFGLALAQPAHRQRSHAAWPQTRRRRASIARETAFVEIGPVTAFAAQTFSALLPFPELRMGWGLDLHWAAVARQHGWRCGVVDAVAIRHGAAPAAAAYSREQAIAEARSFLAARPHLSSAEAMRTLATHRHL